MDNIYAGTKIHIVKVVRMGQFLKRQICSPDEDPTDVRQSSDPEWVSRINRLSGPQSGTTSTQIETLNSSNFLIPVPEYDPSSVSYQNSEPSYGSRPGTAPGLPAPHQAEAFTVPQVTVTSPGNKARLELVD